jgi:hypothetical protein
MAVAVARSDDASTVALRPSDESHDFRPTLSLNPPFDGRFLSGLNSEMTS